ncbi:hypothetical protein M9H77_14459 [Catharanthus roseus]|uniref:Uncharacterized protein n=1 Tax=Catharanthus roseus TaxID=4058 RepID=A0ACC0BN65_CATRO|nr:hypothetical protein M9H77_14459 [Catharanthus roseus]
MKAAGTKEDDLLLTIGQPIVRGRYKSEKMKKDRSLPQTVDLTYYMWLLTLRDPNCQPLVAVVHGLWRLNAASVTRPCSVLLPVLVSSVSLLERTTRRRQLLLDLSVSISSYFLFGSGLVRLLTLRDPNRQPLVAAVHGRRHLDAASITCRYSLPSPVLVSSAMPLEQTLQQRASRRMEWWQKLRRAWAFIRSTLKRGKNTNGNKCLKNNSGGFEVSHNSGVEKGLLSLRDDVETCEYQDVHVMWDILNRLQAEETADQSPSGPSVINKKSHSWRTFFCSFSLVH